MRKLSEITESVLAYHPSANVDIILDAYLYSAKAHRGQSRRSGEAYLSHPVEVAYNLTRLKMDERTVAAGLLHDTIEDTLATNDEIRELFGDEIYGLVDGVTKIGEIEFSSREEKQAENYRKMILAMARDIRVVMIKLADRAHNLRTLGSLDPSRQQRIARETLDIYAALANRLGIGWLKAELEDGSFKYLHPDEYEAIVNRMHQGQGERDDLVKSVYTLLEKELKAVELTGTVTGRSKHYYSIYKKMVNQQIDLEDVYDLIGVRVICESVKDCYAILGLVHSLWRPIPGKFKDYIAMPKPNMYQSLHTTVNGPNGQRVEVQIRTRDMHRVAEEGIAAHWQYKDGGGLSKNADDHLSWVRRLLEDQQEIKNPKDFLSAFKVDLFFQEVYVFTPEGDVIAVPRGATPVDFAYQVHTDIGNHCLGAKVNGKMVPLRYKLKNGDRVEILTSQQRHPSRDWLSFVKTSKARNKISNFINSRERQQSLELGREILEAEIRKYGVLPADLLKGKMIDEAAHACGYNSLDSLFTAIGFGKLPAHQVVEKLLPKETLEDYRKKSTAIKVARKPEAKEREVGIKVKNFGDQMMMRIGKCCNPVPGDPITGYITRGRGISVHHTECPSVEALTNETERMIEVEWDTVHRTPFQTPLAIVGEDEPGLLATISSLLASFDVNITRANVQQASLKRAHFELDVEIFDLSHLKKVLEALRQTKGVIHAERVKEFKKKGPDKKRKVGEIGKGKSTDGSVPVN
ncbi:RelA/SpoT family protein [Nitrospina watsonii]|uniref:GTP pyrophosphokinase n=1 Tax=Nitrospina watsonii TaxID=1323948 RepID=A0ABN8VYS4_9BACT|nr:bifunctional (p)ppGpp synthetase/guanosine-3',5'-bis(diphosphate) 3'-pyrophosphohydrolase [Nitrospina watsonii]CAI2718909.1 GTP pyrophosphokinase [Nitrospina watsonii]